MSRIRRAALPDRALLGRYARVPSVYTDCFTTTIEADVDLSAYVASFYTTWLFRLERVVLRFLVKRPSSDEEARALASGERTDFAAWTVEAREADQLLMCDLHERTRSWFMVVRADGGGTRLFFGSAVVPARVPGAERPRPGPLYRALLPAHRLYSRALLATTASSILR